MQDLLAFAESLADAARPIAMRYFRQALAVETKSDLSPVTLADRLIESQLRELIALQYPGHGIFGEEFAATAPASAAPSAIGPATPRTWVIDPIDGTRSFITGMPLFGTLIALMEGDQPLLGIIDFPALNERWVGLAGKPTRRNGESAHTRDCRQLAQARLYATSPDMFAGDDYARFENLSAGCAMRRFGGDCYAYALLASGHCDLVAEAGLQPYDYLPLVPVIEGAGGRISDWQGQPLGFASDGRVVAAASESLWRAALDRLSQ